MKKKKDDTPNPFAGELFTFYVGRRGRMTAFKVPQDKVSAEFIGGWAMGAIDAIRKNEEYGDIIEITPKKPE